MSILSAFTTGVMAASGAVSEVAGGGGDRYFGEALWMSSAAGMNVSPDRAKRLATVFACVAKKSTAIAMLPFKIYKSDGQGGSTVARNHPLYDLLYSQPNHLQTAYEFKQMMQAHVELRGNAYAEIIPGPRGAVDELMPLHPDRVRVEQLKGSGRLRYQYNDPLTNTTRVLMQDEVFHLRDLPDVVGVWNDERSRLWPGALGPVERVSDRRASGYLPAPPTSMTLTSGAATAVVGGDGIVHPRIEVQWTAPYDRLTRTIQIQYALTSAPTAWIDAPTVDVSSTLTYISNVVVGTQYDVRIRGVRANGGVSVWEEIDGYTVVNTLSTVGQDGVGIGSLTGQAYSSGAAGILCNPFTAQIGSLSVSVLPAGYTITGLVQGQLYEVYYIDPTFSGGAVTPIATQIPSDYLGKLGYFKIDSVITPVNTSGGGGGSGTRYSPAVYHDTGSSTTGNPANAFDGNSSSFATVTASNDPTSGGAGATVGDCLWQSFPMVTLTGSVTLNVIAAVGTHAAPAIITATFGGTTYTLLSTSTTTAGLATTTYTLTIPSGTALNGIVVEAQVSPQITSSLTVSLLKIFEIYINV